MFEREKLIRFQHCDLAGIVFYPQYFVLFSELVEDWFRDGLGVDFAELLTVRGLGIPMVRIECDFLAPSKLGENLTLSLAVKKIGNGSLTLVISARSPAGEERVRATLIVVLVSLVTRRPVPIPPDLRARIEPFQS